jgi:acetylornithine deacetylase/succinyl-diaminopimelate desuccinylase-like protein
MEIRQPLRAALLNGPLLDAALPRLPETIARVLDSSTHTTFSPNVITGGVKTNVVADSAEVVVDIRTMPGDSGPEVRAMLGDAAGDLWPSVEITQEGDNPSTSSPVGTPLWDVLAKVTASLVPGAGIVPYGLFGATDARFFRRKGVIAYGYGIYSAPFDRFASMFHGNDERVDQKSLALSAQLWESTARMFLG